LLTPAGFASRIVAVETLVSRFASVDCAMMNLLLVYGESAMVTV
jgi:hypothetical protein